MRYAIKYNNGGYYKGMSSIGPMFGGAPDEAVPFETEQAALLESGSHFAFVCSDVVEFPEHGKP